MNLTRYLYNFKEVKHSLFLSILRHNSDNTLFWLCEIFYSGYEEDLSVFLLKIYQECFCKTNLLKEYIKKYKRQIKSKVENTRLCAHATFAVTMCFHQYNIVSFVKNYFNIECVQKECKSKFENNIVEIKKEDLVKYKTITKEKSYQVLKEACTISIHKEYAKLFSIEYLDYEQSKNQLQSEWLYYCSETPIWVERLASCDAIKVLDKKEIIFEDDDKMEEFYEQFNYEPDEQPLTVIDKLIGSNNLTQKTLQQFCSEFYLEPINKDTIKQDVKQHSYFVIKTIEVIKEWISCSREVNTQVWKEDSVKLFYSDNCYQDFPVTQIEGENFWTMNCKEIDCLLYNKWANQFNKIDETIEKKIKYLENPKESIHVVFMLNNRLIGFDIVYNNQKISKKKKIKILKDYGVTDFYSISGEWVLSQTTYPETLVCKKYI